MTVGRNKARRYRSTATPPPRFNLGGPFARELMRVQLKRSRNVYDAEDVVQETYLRVRPWEQNKDIKEPLAYLYGAARHAAVDLRNNGKGDDKYRGTVVFNEELAQEAMELMVHNPDIEDEIENQQWVYDLLRQIPPMHAAMIVELKVLGRSMNEIVELYGLSIHTVEKYITQALVHLRILAEDMNGRTGSSRNIRRIGGRRPNGGRNVDPGDADAD